MSLLHVNNLMMQELPAREAQSFSCLHRSVITSSPSSPKHKSLSVSARPGMLSSLGWLLAGVSQELQDLVSRLLEKDPASRMTWAELCGHAFWGASPLAQLAIPEAIAAPRAVQVG